MLTPAAPTSTLSSAVLAGSNPNSGESAPIPGGFAALLTLVGGVGEAMATPDAVMPSTLIQAATGKVGGKMLPPLSPAIESEHSSELEVTPPHQSAAIESVASAVPDDSDPAPPVLALTSDLVAIPTFAGIPTPAAHIPAPAGERFSLRSNTSPTIPVPARPDPRIAPLAPPSGTPASSTLPTSALTAAAPLATLAQPVVTASEPNNVSVQTNAPVRKEPEAPPATGGAPVIAAPLLAVTVQVAARVAIPARVAMTVAVRSDADKVVDEPIAASTVPLAAPVAARAFAPAVKSAPPTEPVSELPMVATSAPADPAVSDAFIAATPAALPQVVSPEVPDTTLTKTPAPAASPLTAAPAPHDFAGLVERLVEARDAVAPLAIRTALHHAEFGRVAMTFSTDQGALAVQMASPDPAFIPAVAAAAQAGMNADSGQSHNPNQPPRHDGPPQTSTSAQGGSNQPQAQSSGRDAREPPSARNADLRETPHPREPKRARDDGGIYA